MVGKKPVLGPESITNVELVFSVKVGQSFTGMD